MDKKYSKGMMYDDLQLDLIKNTFGDKALLYAIRKAFFDVDLLDVDIKALKTITPEVMTVIKKAFKPEVDVTMPLGQTLDLMMTIDFKDKNTDDKIIAIESRFMLISLLELGLDRIQNLTKLGSNRIVQFDVDYSRESILGYVANLYARNTLINHVDTVLKGLELLATQKELTEIEQTKKEKKNSAK